MGSHTPAQRMAAEWLGTLLLVAIVVGSGVMAERLADGNTAIALLANTAATVAGLYVLIGLFAPISGAHLNPLVSVVEALGGRLAWGQVPGYLVAQIAGGCAGAVLAHAMFGLPLLQWGTAVRSGPGLWLAEAVATFGLLLVVLRSPAELVAARVAAFIGAAYWFTASTSFANPAVTLGRMLSDTFAGIAPQSVGAFIAAQAAGAGLAMAVSRGLGNPQRP
jgi:glycerol uptake facilitator-like aquaporin